MDNFTLTKSECRTMVRNKFQTDNFQIINILIEPYSNVQIEHLGEHFRVKISILLDNKPTEAQLFMKTPLKAGHPAKSISEQANCFERKLFYFNLVYSQSPNCTWLPKLYSGVADHLVMEDMSVHGFTLAQNIPKCLMDYAHSKVLFESLAKLSKSGKTFRIGDKYGGQLMEVMFARTDGTHRKAVDWFEQHIRATQTLSGQLPDDERLSKEQFKSLIREKCRQMADEWLSPSKKYRNVLCHGDLWLNNFLFKYDGKIPVHCVMVDFQMLRYLPPMHDVMFYLYVNTTSCFRRKYATDLTRLYFDCLSKELAEVGLDINSFYTWEDYLEMDKIYKKAAIIVAVIYKLVLLFDKKTLSDNIDVLKDFQYFNRSKYLLKYYTENLDYRVQVNDALYELREMILEDTH